MRKAILRARNLKTLCALALLVVACQPVTPSGPGPVGVSPPPFTNRPPLAQDTTDTPTPASDAPPTPLPPGGDLATEGLIAFHTNRDGNWEIFVMGIDGSNRTNLTNHPANDQYPTWSSAGQWIAFQSDLNGHQDIYVMAAPGGLGAGDTGAGLSDPVRITDHRADDRQPAWSPDGTQFAFASTRHKGSEIYVMNVDGSGVVRLTDSEANNEGPAWSPGGFPGGVRIAYMAEEAHYRSALVAVAPDGSRSQRLTSGSSYHDFDPSYSPDEPRIAFASEKTGHLHFEIFAMPATAGWDTAYQEAIQLTDLDGMSWEPDWSPDGTRIAFAAKVDDEWGIYVMDADGSNVAALIVGPDRYDAPAWSPAPGPTE